MISLAKRQCPQGQPHWIVSGFGVTPKRRWAGLAIASWLNVVMGMRLARPGPRPWNGGIPDSHEAPPASALRDVAILSGRTALKCLELAREMELVLIAKLASNFLHVQFSGLEQLTGEVDAQEVETQTRHLPAFVTVHSRKRLLCGPFRQRSFDNY